MTTPNRKGHKGEGKRKKLLRNSKATRGKREKLKNFFELVKLMETWGHDQETRRVRQSTPKKNSLLSVVKNGSY